VKRYRLNALIVLALVFGLIEIVDFRNRIAMETTAGALFALVLWAHIWDKRVARRERARQIREQQWFRAGGTWEK
jgi:uncharacterized membrane protein YqjE